VFVSCYGPVDEAKRSATTRPPIKSIRPAHTEHGETDVYVRNLKTSSPISSWSLRGRDRLARTFSIFSPPPPNPTEIDRRRWRQDENEVPQRPVCSEIHDAFESVIRISPSRRRVYRSAATGGEEGSREGLVNPIGAENNYPHRYNVFRHVFSRSRRAQ